MNEFMEQYWSFYSAGVAIFLFAGFALVLKLIFFKRKRRKKEPHLTFKHWNHRFENDFEHLDREMHAASFLPKEAVKLLKKAKKKEDKNEKLKDKENSTKTLKTIREKLQRGLKTKEVLKEHSNCVYVLTFVGNIMASEVEQLREQISFLLQVAQPADEIVVRITSPGGAVPQYGLASSQLERLKQAGLRCIACVDTVAASGGYMMASVADKIIAAPFAIIGSIGVDRFFECSGAVKAYEAIFSCCSPGAHVVLIGNNAEPVPMNWAILFAKGLEYQTVHRYSHQYEPSIRLLGSGKIDVKPMITHTFKFEESVEAFERAAEHRPSDVKLQIKIDEDN